MRIEHLALNVADPVAMAHWFCEHLGFEVIRHIPQPAQTHFLADAAGSGVVEIYCNPADRVPDYAKMDPLLLHIGFASEDPEADSARLVRAGASVVERVELPDGSLLVMMRDPWGLAIQMCRRAAPLAGSRAPAR